MSLLRLVSPMLSHNMYVLKENGHCVVVDPFFCEKSCALIGEDKLDFMLVTHEHFDHIRGVNEMKEKYGVPLMANSACNLNMQNPAKSFAKFYEAYVKFQSGEEAAGIPFDAAYTCHADEILSDGQVLTWQGHEIRVKMAPGHSAGSNMLFIDEHFAFSGDVLLPPEIPADRFPGGNRSDFVKTTLPYLKELDPTLMMYPGHGERFALGTHYLFKEQADE